MPIVLTTPRTQPNSTEVRLLYFTAALFPQRIITVQYAWGHLDGGGKFVPDPLPGNPDTKIKQRIFTDTTTPSFTNFVQNVPSAGTFRAETETYIKSLEALAGTVT